MDKVFILRFLFDQIVQYFAGLFYNINGRVEAQDTGVYGLSSALSTIDKKDCMLAVETYIRCAEFIRGGFAFYDAVHIVNTFT
jgi:hypothetical protein